MRLDSIEARISWEERVGTYDLWTVSRMRWASSMASSGLGGVPALKKRAATKPAMAPRSRRIAATRKKPQKKFDLLPVGSSHHASHANPCRISTIAASTKTPATAPTTAPLTMRWSFSVISVFASSISSRTMTCARSVTSCSAAVICCGVPVGSAAKALEDQGEQESAGERGADLHLGPLQRGLRRGLQRRDLVGRG